MAELSDIHQEFLKIVEEGEKNKKRLRNSEIYPLVQELANIYLEKGSVQALLATSKLDPEQKMVKKHHEDLIEIYFLENLHPESQEQQEAKIEVLEMLCTGIPDEGYVYIEQFAFDAKSIKQPFAIKLLAMFMAIPSTGKQGILKEKFKANYDQLDSDAQTFVKAYFAHLFPNEVLGSSATVNSRNKTISPTINQTNNQSTSRGTNTSYLKESKNNNSLVAVILVLVLLGIIVLLLR